MEFIDKYLGAIGYRASQSTTDSFNMGYKLQGEAKAGWGKEVGGKGVSIGGGGSVGISGTRSADESVSTDTLRASLLRDYWAARSQNNREVFYQGLLDVAEKAAKTGMQKTIPQMTTGAENRLKGD